jgi:hypothetical protein
MSANILSYERKTDLLDGRGIAERSHAAMYSCAHIRAALSRRLRMQGRYAELPRKMTNVSLRVYVTVSSWSTYQRGLKHDIKLHEASPQGVVLLTIYRHPIDEIIH